MNKVLQKVLLGMTLTAIFGGGATLAKADDVNTSSDSSGVNNVLANDSNSTQSTQASKTSLADQISSTSQAAQVLTKLQAATSTSESSSTSYLNAETSSTNQTTTRNVEEPSSNTGSSSSSSSVAEVATSSATASVGSDTASQASQTGKVLADGSANADTVKKAPRNNNTQAAKQAASTLATTMKGASQNNLTFYNDVDEAVVGSNGNNIYNRGYNYSYDNLDAVKYNGDTRNDKAQVINDYANLTDSELKEVNFFAAQLLNTARQSVWAVNGQDSNTWQLMITKDSLGLAVKVAQGYTRDRHSISTGTHDTAVLKQAYSSYGLHGYSEDYGSTALNYAATMTTNRKTTMYDLKKVVFQTLNLMLYDDMPATSGGSNAGADGNGHAYSLAYGWDQYSFGANYFGLAFDQMGQVHIVNFRPSMIWSDTHFDTNQLVYTKTLGNTSALTKNVPTAYSNYLKASVFNNDSSISYVKEKVVGNTAYYFVTRNGQLNIYDSSLKKLTGKVTIDGVVYNLSNEVLNNKVSQPVKTVNTVAKKNGQYNEGGKWYLYKNGVKQTGFQYIADQHKTVYYNKQGQMQNGQQNINGKWYLFDKWTGAMKTGLQYIADQHKTVYYNKQGQMQHGQQNINGKWYLFDKWTGGMKTGLQYIADQHKTVYYASNGQMQYGQQNINGKWYLFDKWTGTMKTGLQYIVDQHKTVYYASNGQMQYGQQNINGKWYLFDSWTGAMKTGFQYIASQHKTVYYNGNGQMVYGWQNINGRKYFFDVYTGSLR